MKSFLIYESSEKIRVLCGKTTVNVINIPPYKQT